MFVTEAVYAICVPQDRQPAMRATNVLDGLRRGYVVKQSVVHDSGNAGGGDERSASVVVDKAFAQGTPPQSIVTPTVSARADATSKARVQTL